MREIIIWNPKQKVKTVCPTCNNKYQFSVKRVRVVCSRCRFQYIEQIMHSPLIFYIDMVDEILSKENAVLLKATKDREDTLNKIRERKLNQKCWDVSEIEDGIDIKKRKKCKDCGLCGNCKTCYICYKQYNPRIRKKCPSCKSDKVKETRIKKFVRKDGKNLCPYCNSTEVFLNHFYEGDVCNRCGSDNLIQGGEIEIKKLIIKRLPKFEI